MKGHNRYWTFEHFFHSGFIPLDVFKNPNFSVSIQQPEYPCKQLCEIRIVLMINNILLVQIPPKMATVTKIESYFTNSAGSLSETIMKCTFVIFRSSGEPLIYFICYYMEFIKHENQY